MQSYLKNKVLLTIIHNKKNSFKYILLCFIVITYELHKCSGKW